MLNSNKLKTFLIQYPSGLGKIASEIVSRNFKRPEIVFSNKEHLAVRTNSPVYNVTLPYFETVYLISDIYKNHDLNSTLQETLNSPNLENFLKQIALNRNVSFRIVESKPDYKNKKQYRKLVNKIETKLQQRNIHIDRSNPDFDIRIGREEDFSFVGIRVSQAPEYIDYFQQKSIRKEIASTMIYLSEPKNQDIFLDPFSGGGIIPILRSQMFKYKQIIAADKDISALTEKVQKLDFKIKEFEVYESKLQDLSNKLKSKVNKIVTDPPWGHLDKNINIPKFYKNMFNTFVNILNPDSIVVLISPHQQIIHTLLEKKSDFQVIKEIETSASGRKTHIYKILFIKK